NRKEKGPKGEPLGRPRLLFNPRDGRLAYPHLLPHAGQRPPFAPRTGLTQKNGSKAWEPTPDAAAQGTAYLGKVFNPTDPDFPTGTHNGSGLAPANAKSVKHFDVVVLQLPINYATYSGGPVPGRVDFGSLVVTDTKKVTIEANDAPVKHWLSSSGSSREVMVSPGDRVTWIVRSGKHGVMFTDWDVAKQVLKIEGGLEVKPQPGIPAPAQGTEAKEGDGFVLLVAT